MLYVVRGEVEVNGVPATTRTMVELERHAGTDLHITAWDDDALVLLCHGDVIDEPVVVRTFRDEHRRGVGKRIWNTSREFGRVELTAFRAGPSCPG